ncbi:MAG: YitT family protein [Saprospiraceae bacterium]|nr:YitT family protein [Saprospiraceae bacterium]
MEHKTAVQLHRILTLRALVFLILGVLCAGVALKGFMIPNHFLDGGITGISILLHEVTHFNISLILLGLNLPFVVIGFRKIGRTFGIISLCAIVLLAVFMHFIHIPAITDDKILIAVFGGFLIGLGIGFVIRGGGVIDGMEVIADYTNRKVAFSSGEIIMLINTILFLCAAIFFGIETALYSILTYFTAMKTSDYVIDGFDEYTAITVVSTKPEEIKRVIVEEFDKAIFVYKGERGYLPGSFNVKHDCDIVVSIVTRLETHRLTEYIAQVDPKAFMFLNGIKEVRGGVIRKKTAH